MPAALYARYVPPKKNSQPVKAPSTEPTPAPNSSQNQLYARYVPPKKQKPAVLEIQPPAVFASENTSPEQPEKSGSKKRKRPDGEKKSKSKEKKHKTRAIEVAAKEPADVTQTADLVQDDSMLADAQIKAEAEAMEHEEHEYSEQEDEDEMEASAILAKYSMSEAANRVSTAVPAEENRVSFADVEWAGDEGGEGKDDSGEDNDDDNEAAAGAEAILSKYRTSLTLSQKRSKKEQAAAAAREKSPSPVLHGLEPLPQPEKAPYVPYKATFSSLPSWISNPRAVQSDASSSFTGYKLSRKVAESLARKKFENAMAVQTAVLPLLLPGRDAYEGDICVSAPTGSGKTLSYVLPMVEHLQKRAMTRLRGLIVVPTRELVAQAKELIDICSAGTGVNAGIAVGSVALGTEQAELVKRYQRYDPEARKALDEEADRRIMLGYDKDDELLHDIMDLWPGHVPEYHSTVDILICTPGRLVDHIRTTPGFTVEHCEWLVIDEADRLLDSNFQDWVDVVLPSLEMRTESDSRSRILATLKEKAVVKKIRKVILSATMTRDLSKLASLKLHRPTFVAVVEPEKPNVDGADADADVDEDDADDTRNVHATILPSTLSESAIPVGDGSEKPLILLQLLQDRLKVAIEGATSTAMVFCSNDDNATRLTRLLILMSPTLEPHVAALTKSTDAGSRRKLLSSFSSTTKPITILISTDRTSRGLDVDNLSYVINYDIPPSVTSYVHRVGRTARAGKSGEAWTLFSRSEGAFFWNDIATGKAINRSDRTIERVRLDELGEEKKEAYWRALEELGNAVKGR